MATIYRGASPTRLPFSTHAHTHYTTNIDPAVQIQMQLRYNAYAMDGGLSAPLPTTPPTRGSSGLSGFGPSGFSLATPPPVGGLRHMSSPMYSSSGGASMYMSSMMGKLYPQPPPPEPAAGDLLLVAPGLPTPVELSIYENKQPTGFLHVTAGNQTVEFLDGVANMPQKR
jgi:hypothetical protein